MVDAGVTGQCETGTAQVWTRQTEVMNMPTLKVRPVAVTAAMLLALAFAMPSSAAMASGKHRRPSYDLLHVVAA